MKKNRSRSGDLRRMPRRPKLPLLILALFFLSSPNPAFSAPAGFYTLSEKWERTSEAPPKEDAVEKSFASALSHFSHGSGPMTVPAPPDFNRSIAELAAQTAVVEIEIGQSLFVDTRGQVIKFVATDEGIVAMETIDENTLRILGSGVGRTFIHVWDAVGRGTFELHVAAPKLFFVTPKQTGAAGGGRPFRLSYNNTRAAAYTGDKFPEARRASSDFTQNFGVTGDTPHGGVTGRLQTRQNRDKTELTEIAVEIKDGQMGPFKDFDLNMGDVYVAPGFMSLPGTRLRGVELMHSDARVGMTGFTGRQGISSLGTLAPGVISKTTRNSDLSGGVMDFRMTDATTLRTGAFFGEGTARADELNRRAFGTEALMKLGPHVKFNPEIDFDSEHWAKKADVDVRFDRFEMQNQVRDISKKFNTIIGSPNQRGELGYKTSVGAQVGDNLHMTGSLDVFKDRLVPNPDKPDKNNLHTDLALSYAPRESTTVALGSQFADDTGRAGPARNSSYSAQVSERFKFFDRRVSSFARYSHRDNENINSPLSNYLLDQLTVGLQSQIFWDINFSVQKEWDRVDEINVPRVTHPHAITYLLNYSKQIGDTPFYMDAYFRHRDEEETESPTSFMSGIDTTEISGGLYYRGTQDMEIFLTGSFESQKPESLNVLAPSVSANFATGVKVAFDTGFTWSSVGSFEGFVFKDMNGDGLRQSDERGMPGMVIASHEGKEAVTDSQGHYELHKVSGRKAVLTLDSSKFPYGFAASTGVKKEIEIVPDKLQQVNFGVSPRSEITGIVFNDLNGNDKYDLTDIGLKKVKVRLEGGPVARSNTQGVYNFPNMIAGQYTASLDMASLAEGYLPVDVPKKKITLYEGIRYELNFPVRATRVLSGRVYVDENGNARMDASESPLSGVKVLFGEKENISDKGGWYIFDNLNGGSFILGVDPNTLPDGYDSPLPETVELGPEPFTVPDKNIVVVRSKGRRPAAPVSPPVDWDKINTPWMDAGHSEDAATKGQETEYREEG